MAKILDFLSSCICAAVVVVFMYFATDGRSFLLGLIGGILVPYSDFLVAAYLDKKYGHN